MKERRELVGLALFLGLPVLLWWWIWTRPELYKTATSPDGGWSVRVLREKNLLYPLVDGVPVTVEARDGNGKLLVRELIDNCDRWSHVEYHYPDVRCTNDSILVGPDWWGSGKAGHFWIRRADLSYAKFKSGR